MKKDSTVLLAAVAGSFAVIVLIGLALSYAPNVLTPEKPTPTPGGLIIENVHVARDFTLTDQNNQPFKFSSLRGKAVLVFYGYTHCPDICPLTMADFKRIKSAFQQAAPSQADRVAFVMISVDGLRDTPDVMKRYIDQFDPSFIGLTGNPDQVANIGLDYGVKVEKQQSSNTQATYLIAHTSFTYLFDQQGNWRIAYPFDTPDTQITSDVQRMLQN